MGTVGMGCYSKGGDPEVLMQCSKNATLILTWFPFGNPEGILCRPCILSWLGCQITKRLFALRTPSSPCGGSPIRHQQEEGERGYTVKKEGRVPQHSQTHFSEIAKPGREAVNTDDTA